VSGRQNRTAWEFAQKCRSTWPRTTFLATLEQKALRDLVCCGNLERFAKGTPLIREGEKESDVLLLLRAVVKVTARLDSGDSGLLAVRVGGDVMGEIAYTDGGVRTATVTACRNEAVAVRICPDVLRDTLKRHPDASRSLTSVITRRFRTSTQRCIDISGAPPWRRLGRALLEVGDDYGVQTSAGTLIGVGLSQAELGTLVGVAEKTVQRALGELRERGLVETSGRQHYTLLDQEKLR